MKIFISARFSPDTAEALRQDWKVDFKRELSLMPKDELVARLSDVDVLVTQLDRVTASVMDLCPNLKVIADCRGNPVNIDVKAATEHGVLVLHTPGRNADAVADLAVALMLMCARHILPACNSVVSGKWYQGPRLKLYLAMQGIELKGRTAGLVGLGAVAQKLARRLHGFEMQIVAYDPYVDAEKAATLGVRMTTLEEIMRLSDFVSLHVPVTDETRGMIGTEQLALMKPTAYLINTSRSAAIDMSALTDTLQEKRIAGAGLDVYDREPLPPDDPLTQLDNVVLTPHIGGATYDVVLHHSHMVYDDLTRLANGELPTHIFNPEVVPSFLARFGGVT